MIEENENVNLANEESTSENFEENVENEEDIVEIKENTTKNEEIQEKIHELENEFSGNGRVLIRPSGTEPLVRVMIEGEDIQYITTKAKELASLIEEKLK